jgi:DNA-binding response OmpR family regulator
VITANNGEVAYQVALREMPDLILLDVRMPRMTGYQVCRLLNEHQSTRMIPIIFLSVKSQESESNTGLEPGEEYIHKIFSMDELLERIHTIMKGTAP